MPTAPVPLTVPTVTTPDPFRSFACTPRVVTDVNAGGVPWLAVVVQPSTPECERAAAGAMNDGGAACRAVLAATRDEFFATGPGEPLRDKEQKLADAERAAGDAATALAQLREQWRSAVATDATKDVVGLEEQISDRERQAERLKVRLPVLREEVAKLRTGAATELYGLLRTARATYEQGATRRLADAEAALTAAVNAAWGGWLRSRAEVDGSEVSSDELVRMAAAAGSAPVLPAVRRPAPPTPAVQYPWCPPGERPVTEEPDDAPVEQIAGWKRPAWLPAPAQAAGV